jgi:ADP-ribose pyrophosphatase
MSQKPFGADDVEIVERDIAYRGFFRIDRYRLKHRLYDGGWSEVVTREVFERGHAAAVLPYDPDTDRVVLIEQFRTGALAAGETPWLVEIVAGIIEDGEAPEDVVRREAREEAGVTVDRLEPVAYCFLTPGGASETCRIFCGRTSVAGVGGIHGVDGEQEDIRVSVHGVDVAARMIADGRIKNVITIVALQWLLLHRSDVRTRWRSKPS